MTSYGLSTTPLYQGASILDLRFTDILNIDCGESSRHLLKECAGAVRISRQRLHLSGTWARRSTNVVEAHDRNALRATASYRVSAPSFASMPNSPLTGIPTHLGRLASS